MFRYAASLFALITGLGVWALPSLAQDQASVETISSAGPDLIAERVVGKGLDLRGVRVAKPGALLFASFDDDKSLSISLDEIRNNAGLAFERADTDNSGVLSIFEQQDWAEMIGAGDGPLANAVSFDSDINRQVTLEEFEAGLVRISRGYVSSETGEIAFASLLMPPNGKDKN